MANSTYLFTYQDDYDEEVDGVFGQKRIENRVTLDDCAQWSAVLKHFVTFLSSVYGYDVSKQVKFPDPYVPSSMFDEVDEDDDEE